MKSRFPFVLILLSMAQFILVLDSTLMNVSISTLVVDLDTTVTSIQACIAFYSLVMGSLMVAGAKIGDLIGRRRAFIIGLIIYAAGSLITSLSQNVQMLAFGWSFLEGVGAALVMPAMLSMVASNFKEGPERVRAYGVLAAMAAIGAAVGPILGGFLTTYITWRLAFFGEVLVALFIILYRKRIQDASVPAKEKRFDYGGLLLSATGLIFIVLGILSANSYGLVYAREALVIAGNTLIEEGALAPLYWLVAIGVMILIIFLLFERKRLRQGKVVLVDPGIFKNKGVLYGCLTTMPYQLVLAGVLFSVSIISQVILEYPAFNAGIVLLPLSLSVLVVALLGARLAKRMAPTRIIRIGIFLLALGSILLGLGNFRNPNSGEFLPFLIIIGAGIGLVASQLNNIILSAVPEKRSNEASGLSTTSQQIGMSLGTALGGSILLSVFVLSFTNLVNESQVFSADQKSELTNIVQTKAQTLSNSQLDTYLTDLDQPVREEILSINNQAENRAASASLIAIGVIGSLGLLTATRLPKSKVAVAPNKDTKRRPRKKTSSS